MSAEPRSSTSHTGSPKYRRSPIGQSCCAIERIYVDARLYDSFVEGFVALTRQYRLGNPLDTSINLGPLVRSTGLVHAHSL